MYDVVIETSPAGEARVIIAVAHEIYPQAAEDVRGVLKSISPENEYSIATAEAIALGNLTTTGEHPC